MRRIVWKRVGLSCVLVLGVGGCGDSSTDTEDGTSTANSAGPAGSGLVTGNTVDSNSGGTQTGGTETGGSNSGGTETGSTTMGSGASNSATATATSGFKFDLEAPDIDTMDPCAGEPGDPPFSYIWIANSVEGTVSKINTFTTIEEGRYAAAPGLADPSRTSVNLLGDVAVVDRNGGIAKIAARVEDCVDSNNNGQIETSSGPNNVLPWGQDECVLWHLPLASSGMRGPRPVAWVGNYNEATCTGDSPFVWVGHYHQTQNKGMFFRLAGDSGAIDAVVEHPWSGNTWGPYGGAVNAAGDFWVLGWQTGPLIRVDYETLQVSHHETPHLVGEWTYGMTVDANGDPWIASSSYVHHFNAQTQQWTNIPALGSYRGLMADAAGNVWAARNGPCGVAHLDVATKSIIGYIDNFGCGTPVGISIDVEGFVWVVDQTTQSAFKIHPETYQVAGTATGLVQPYTYSDMTGAGLNLVVNPPG